MILERREHRESRGLAVIAMMIDVEVLPGPIWIDKHSKHGSCRLSCLLTMCSTGDLVLDLRLLAFKCFKVRRSELGPAFEVAEEITGTFDQSENRTERGRVGGP